jgi:hypothetical protein
MATAEELLIEKMDSDQLADKREGGNGAKPADARPKGTVSRDGFGFCGHAWSVLCLNRGRGPFLNFLGAPMNLQRKKCISCGK